MVLTYIYTFRTTNSGYMRRPYVELDSRVKKSLEKFGKSGASVREIANEAKINWRTTRNILEKFEKLGIAENVVAHQRLKIYRIKEVSK